MSQQQKLLDKILSGLADNNVAFTSLCTLLERLGFNGRTKGSHHIYSKSGVAEIINVQPKPDGKAKAYQVKQVRDIVIRYKLQLPSKD